MEKKTLSQILFTSIHRGTLIWEEIPQCTAEASGRGDLNWIMSVTSSFDRMSQTDQEKYLQLHNIFKNTQDLQPEKIHGQNELKLMMNKIFGVDGAEKVLAILNIFETNFFSDSDRDFLGIQTSRFNHSCFPNADWFSIPEKEEIEIRAMSRIKEGDEITIKYFEGSVSMNCKKLRQECLMLTQNFICSCDSCKESIVIF